MLRALENLSFSTINNQTTNIVAESREDTNTGISFAEALNTEMTEENNTVASSGLVSLNSRRVVDIPATENETISFRTLDAPVINLQTNEAYFTEILYNQRVRAMSALENLDLMSDNSRLKEKIQQRLSIIYQ